MLAEITEAAPGTVDRVVDSMVSGGVAEIVLGAVAVGLTVLWRRSGRNVAKLTGALDIMTKVVAELDQPGNETERADRLAALIISTYERNPAAARVIDAAMRKAENQLGPRSSWMKALTARTGKPDPPK